MGLVVFPCSGPGARACSLPRGAVARMPTMAEPAGDFGPPLKCLRVVECASWAGAFGGRLLADGGADVVRVVPHSGDSLAEEPPYFGTSGVSIQSAWYNAGKRIVALDTGNEVGIRTLLELISNADLLIEDWSPGKPLLSDTELASANPALARISVTPMGLDGPLAALITNDLVANALCGSASVTGNADTPPLSGYGNQSYHTVGFYVAVCALAAVRSARLSGTAQHVDLSAHEALVSCTEQVLMQWFFPGGTWKKAVAARQGSLHWSKAYEVYPAKDGVDVMVTASMKLADVLLPWVTEDGAAQDLANPEKFPNIVSIIRDLPYLMSVLRDWVATYDGDALFYEAQRRHQPFGAVWSIGQALARSPQIRARGYLKQQMIPGAGAMTMPGPFFRTSADGEQARPSVSANVADVVWTPRERKTPGIQETAGASKLPLAGVRVLDFTHVLAGPFGTRVLADLGADVIKVGTASRGGGANTPDHPYFVMWNRNKRNVCINMASAEGRAIAVRLAAECDLITENFSAGVLRRWGMDRQSLQDVNPGISVIAMGGMGQDGPWKDFVTYAPTIHALVGLTYLTNPPGRHDIGYGFSLTDHLSGLAGAVAALEALEYRDRTGQGLDIDLSQYELGLGLMAPALIDHLANGTDPEPVGNRHPFGGWAPHGIYRCKGDDRWVALAVRGDDEWARLCTAMGQPELVNDPRFATHTSRIANQDVLDENITAWTVTRDRYDTQQLCQAHGLAAGAVQDAEDLATRDVQLLARNFFTSATAERWGEYGLERFPARFNGQRPDTYDGVHQVGEDTFDVMTALVGLSDDEFAELAASGVFT